MGMIARILELALSFLKNTSKQINFSNSVTTIRNSCTNYTSDTP